MLRCNPTTRLQSPMMPTFSLFMLISFIVLASAIPSSKTASLAYSGSLISFAKIEKDSLRARFSVAFPSIQKGWLKKDVKSNAPVRVNFPSQESEEENKKPLPKNSLLMSVRQQGLSGSRCSTSTECQGGRTCQAVFGATRCAFADATFTRCFSASDCVVLGEFCIMDTRTGVSACLSQDFATEAGISVGDSGPGTNPPTTNGQATSETQPSTSETQPSTSETQPSTSETQPSTSETQPSNSETQPSTSETQPSTSETQDTANGNEPCIAIDSLRHLSREQLVFENDILSNVLCDKNLSCATAGHMVTYRGKGMMMKSYCEAVGGCMKRVMLVNSPRYRMKLAVPSKSDNLVFTAMSARYVTRAEEQVLSAAIRMGL